MLNSFKLLPIESIVVNTQAESIRIECVLLIISIELYCGSCWLTSCFFHDFTDFLLHASSVELTLTKLLAQETTYHVISHRDRYELREGHFSLVCLAWLSVTYAQPMWFARSILLWFLILLPFHSFSC